MSRTAKGLRDILFDEIEELRGPNANPSKSAVVIKAAGQILSIAKTEIELMRQVGVDADASFLIDNEPEQKYIEAPKISEPVGLEVDDGWTDEDILTLLDMRDGPLRLIIEKLNRTADEIRGKLKSIDDAQAK